MACGRSQTSFVLKSRSESSRNAIATVNFYSLQVQPGHKRTRTRNKYLHLLQKSTAQFSDMRAQVAAGLLFLFSCNGMDNFPDSSRAIREVADRTTEIPTPQRRHHPNARYQLTSNPNGLISGQPNTQGSHGDRVMFTPSRYGRADSAWPSKLGEHERVDMSGGRSQNPSTEKNVAEVASESVGKNDLAPRRKVRNGFKRKALDITDEHSASQSWKSPLPLDLKGRPEVTKLMGFYMGPQPLHSLDQAYPFGKANGIKIVFQDSDFVSPERSADACSSSIPSIASVMSVLPPGRPLGEFVDDKMKRKHASCRLSFDLEVFSPPQPYQTDEGNLEKILNLMSVKLKGSQELVMSEGQFIQNRDCFFPRRGPASNRAATGPTKVARTSRYTANKKKGFDTYRVAFEFLVTKKSIWLQYWQNHTKQLTNFRQLIENMRFYHQPERMQNIMVLYLWNVQMISTTVPEPTEDINLGSQLEGAFELVDNMFSPGN
ncbi:hypothetical protein PSHT_06349 [Puccinia striiformis]|uniref:Uncharacterized protein n=1 Tax=Puccinia striiformis TaxID=27350 RepID=A0A2S4W6W7_9BASI|nr:hypothetical protein PSHT_06349 [Puccinia striiformis]